MFPEDIKDAVDRFRVFNDARYCAPVSQDLPFFKNEEDVEFLKMFDTSACVWVDTGDGVPRPKTQDSHSLFGHLFGVEEDHGPTSDRFGDPLPKLAQQFHSPLLEGVSPRNRGEGKHEEEQFEPTEDIVLSETAPIVVRTFLS